MRSIMPPFLLLMPSYNQAHYIGEAVRSVLHQDDPDWELWIVDNSSDATPGVMAEFRDPRIHFHHIPQRMDPGSCLNWMLERVHGRDFSYVHTDNNLAPDYVRRMREGLASHPLGLAYCDMRMIDQDGRPLQVLRRGEFLLPRLLSLRPLGVPFAATTELARRLGGFSCEDLADDVHFCSRAYGVAQYVYVRRPLLDYRVHPGSRTSDSGGDSGMHMNFIRSHAKVLKELMARQLQPLDDLRREIGNVLDDIDWLVEDVWYRYLAQHGARWNEGRPDLEGFFGAGLIRLPCDAPGGTSWVRTGRRQRRFRLSARSWPHVLRLRIKLQQELRRRGSQLRDVLVPWAYLSLGAPSAPISFRLGSKDARTVWGAALLERNLGWRPVSGADAAAREMPLLTLQSCARLGGAGGDAPSGDQPADGTAAGH